MLRPEPDGVHAAGEAGLLLRRRGGGRRGRGLLPLQGLQARPRLHGPQGMPSTPFLLAWPRILDYCARIGTGALGGGGSRVVMPEAHRYVAWRNGDRG